MLRLAFLFVLMFNQLLFAKDYPANNQVINHLQVMYQTESHNHANSYTFLIYQDKNLIDKYIGSYPVYLGKTILEYSRSYSMVIEKKDNKLLLERKTIYFKTAKNNRATKGKYEIRITDYNNENTMDGIVFMDNNFAVNRAGKVVYCVDTSISFIRNFHVTNSGTLLYLDSVIVIETDLNGKKTWQSPMIKNKDFTVTEYHHDMVKTKKETYLCIASVKYHAFTQQVKYNILIEFDKKNHIKWIWHEKDYYPNDSNFFRATHVNSLYYDEENEKIYLSNRDLHAIIAIDKKSGKPDWTFGYPFPDVYYVENQIIKMQHRVIKLNNSNFLVFNNDSGDANTANTRIMEITNPSENDGQVSIVWEYPFNFSNTIENFVPRMGGATKLANGNYLIATGSFDRNFEITPDGEIVWTLRMEQHNPILNKNIPVSVYRNNFATSLYPNHHTVYQHKNKYYLLNSGTDPIEVKIALSKGLQKATLKPNEKILLTERPISSFSIKK